MESNELIEKLINSTSLRSEGVKKALRLHFVNGYNTLSACDASGIAQQQFDRAKDVLNKKYRELESDVNSNNSKAVA